MARFLFDSFFVLQFFCRFCEWDRVAAGFFGLNLPRKQL